MASPAPRVFVSHSHKDDEFTTRLVTDLIAAGADVWVDVVGIDSGDFLKRINDALASREWLVLVLTPDALRSQWVQTEVHAAMNLVVQGRMRQVIPILAKPCDVSEIPPTWDVLHRYDATRDYQAALSGLLHVLGLAAPGGQPAPPPRISAQPSIPPDRFPSRLASLGYQANIINGVEAILPPLCDVPAGAFLMGSDPSQDKQAQDREKPQHWVTLPGFQIARYPVTVAEYACFVRTGHPEPKSLNVSWQAQLEQGRDHPVVRVSCHNAVAYAAWLAERTGQPWQLPSEAEWEKAARWDPATRSSRIYPWGDTFEAGHANTNASGKGGTTSVASYPSGASPCGAREMAGNVWEWTSSLFESYPYHPDDGREALDSTGNRILRGGSWNGFASNARTACRFDQPPYYASHVSGFRVLLAAIGS